MTKRYLQAEGLVVLMISIGYYSVNDYNWWVFLALLLIPDLSMVGYLFNNKVGALLYNLFHTYVPPLFVVMIGFMTNQDLIVSLAIIWVAHIGMDRALGFGLKYNTGFKDTHMQRV